MRIEINYSPSTEHYVWKLWTGPDGIDDYEGVAISLGECFQEIIRMDTLNATQYFGVIEND